MLITAAVCTWNRAELLKQCLEQLTKIVIPLNINWELLVVNNNCTDATDQVIASLADRLPIRRLFESKQGISNARNRVLSQAKGDYILFIDDDVLIKEDLLVAYLKVIETNIPNIAFMGGPIDVYFPQAPDAALVSAIPTVGDGFCGRSVMQDKVIESAADYMPNGANFVLCSKLVKGVTFNTNLGPVGRQRICGEELNYFRDLLKKGLKGYWTASACVRHYVPPSRFSLAYLTEHLFGLGRTAVRLNGIPSQDRFSETFARLSKIILKNGLNVIRYRIFFNRRDCLFYYAQFLIKLGTAYEYLQQSFKTHFGF